MTDGASSTDLEPLGRPGGEPVVGASGLGAEELTPELVADVRALDRPVSSLPAVQAAAVAATGFVAGAATIAVVHHRRARKVVRRERKKRPADLLDVVGSRSFLVDVHLLGRR